MTLLQQEKSSEKTSFQQQIENIQQSLSKKDTELVAVQGELQKVCFDGKLFFKKCAYYIIFCYKLNR